MTPSQRIMHEAAQTFRTVEPKGRRMLLRRLTALDTLRLFKAAGPVLAQNEPWLSMAALAFSVSEIDGVPIPAPISEVQIEAIVDRLGDDGLAVIANAIRDEHLNVDIQADVGNLPGTPS